MREDMVKVGMDFYPRSPCGERPLCIATTAASINFYPRSPCGERPDGASVRLRMNKFLSTLSLRRATARLVVLGNGELGFLSTLSLRRATG